MEFKEYLKLLRKNFKLIAGTSLVVAISAFLFSTARPVKYDVSQSIFINKNGSQETDNFKYDGYYAFEAADSLSDSIAEWLKSPEIVNAIYKESGVDPNLQNIKSYSKMFKAKKLSAEFVEITFQSQTRDEASKVSGAIVKILESKMEAIDDASNSEVSFSIGAGSPVVVENKPDALLNFAIGIISGLILGIFVVVGREYFHEKA